MEKSESPNPNPSEITFLRAQFKSPLYEQSIVQRQAILRTPLGMKFTQEQLDAESDMVHFVGCISKKGLPLTMEEFSEFSDENEDLIIVCSSVLVLMPSSQNGEKSQKLKVRQVLVGEKYQKQGFGSLMNNKIVKFALQNKATYIYCHARDAALNFYKKCGWEVKGDSFEEVGLKHWYMYCKIDLESYIQFHVVDQNSPYYPKMVNLRIDVLLKQLSEADRIDNLQDNK